MTSDNDFGHLRRTMLWVTILGFAGVGLWCWHQRAMTLSHAAPLPEDSRPQLVLGLGLQPAVALVLVALDKQYFQQAGVEVTVLEYPSGKRALREGLLPQKVDIVTTADVPLAIAAAEQQEVRVIAEISSAENVNRIVARSDVGIEEPADLMGRRIGTQRASAVHFFLYLFLLEQGIGMEAIDKSFLLAEELPQALEQGDIDAFSMREPYISEACERLPGRTLIFSSPGLYEQAELLVTNQRTLEQKPEALQRFLQGICAAEAYCLAHPRESQAIAEHYLKLEPGELDDVWQQLTFSVSLRQSLIILLENVARWAIQSRIVSIESVPDYQSFVDTSLLEEIQPQSISMIK